MPAKLFKTWSKKYDIPKKQLERRWKSAKKRAALQGHKGNYSYIMGIFKKQNGIREHILNFFRSF